MDNNDENISYSGLTRITDRLEATKLGWDGKFPEIEAIFNPRGMGDDTTVRIIPKLPSSE